MTQQLASCAAAEALDGLLVRPGCLAGGIVALGRIGGSLLRLYLTLTVGQVSRR